MNLIRDQVVQFHHVDQTNHHALIKEFTGPAVHEGGFSILIEFGLLEEFTDLRLVDAVKYWRGHVEAEGPGGDPQMGLEHLTDVHTRRHTERIQNDVHWGPVRQERHVFFRHNLGHDTLVTVTSGHLVADGDLPFGGHIDLHLFDHARIDILT